MGRVLKVLYNFTLHAFSKKILGKLSLPQAKSSITCKIKCYSCKTKAKRIVTLRNLCQTDSDKKAKSVLKATLNTLQH